MFVKYEAEVSSRVSGNERGVVDFGKLFPETIQRKFSLGGVQCTKICGHPGRNSYLWNLRFWVDGKFPCRHAAQLRTCITAGIFCVKFPFRRVGYRPRPRPI